MARSIAMEEDAPVYRAVIVRSNSETGVTYRHCEGPYALIGAARARVTFWKNYLSDTSWSVEGHVERGTVSWAPVE